MPSTFNRPLHNQFLAALAMLEQCIQRCPAQHWDNPATLVAKYPAWLVAYHTLCYLDLYLSPSETVYQPRTQPIPPATLPLHPKAWDEFNDEYPSRTFSQQELLAYAQICREKIKQVLGEGPTSETAESLAGPSGFSRYPIPRAEFHLNNLRHVQHHTGQLTALLRRLNVETSWVRTAQT